MTTATTTTTTTTTITTTTTTITTTTTTTNNYQYRWLSPLRDIHPSIVGPEMARSTEDNPMSNIDSTLFTEKTPQASVHPRTLRSTSYENDLSVNQLFQWPTMSEYVTSPSINETSRQTG